ncbi:hypothetical protein DJ533_07700 [Acinetobacter defluvii]|uniref:Uncharacterized protein n=1 Tax=Acinetobacter defluvii TaxID=1871111 RepID=A0A2S2FBU4_9GAMM|nr:hypothetical protein [Acinetobacter defluvii]AWL28456.1 hypothetical protein DJ533_07700 [Acinetobacter defluvii]
MKCHKCYAENINEAVKCGICGVRLKHQKSFDDFTGSQHVQSSIRRETQKQHQLPHDNTLNKDNNSKNHLRKLLIFLQRKTLKAQGRDVESPLKNKKVLFFILWAMIIFVIAIIDIMGNSYP